MKAIGVCGPSGSGKTTLAEMLCDEFNGTLLSLDNYFFPDPPVKKYPLNGQNWELPENVDWEACRRDLLNLKKGTPTTVRKMDWDTEKYTEVSVVPKDIVVAEGFLLLWDRALVAMLDLTLYIDVPDEVGLARRMAREGSVENQKWFEEVTFPEYKRHRKTFEQRASIILNGEESLDSIHHVAAEAIRHLDAKKYRSM